MDLVGLCTGIMMEAHDGQVRKLGADKGRPYSVHPLRVAGAVLCHGVEAQCAALLHDTIEDGGFTVEKLLARGVPKSITVIVELLSRRPGETYYDFIQRIAMSDNDIAIRVKIADINDNLESLEECSLKDKYRLAKFVLEMALDLSP